LDYKNSDENSGDDSEYSEEEQEALKSEESGDETYISKYSKSVGK